jgi:MFS superfamily sulfate permease-like transporter
MTAKSNTIATNVFALALVAGAIGLLAFKHYENAAPEAQVRLLNVSYDPTRELYAQLNPRFIAQYKRDTGEIVGIEQSHGGSSKQARSVAAGAGRLLIDDLEGELFFGAAPELERYLSAILAEAQRTGIQHVIMRFRRARNPDAGAIEHLERFLRDATKLGVTVLLAGVRPDFVKILKNVGMNKWYPSEYIFPEEDRKFSATLRAVRYASRLVNQTAQDPGEDEVYYLV